MSPNELLKLGIIDGIIGEPHGGAHRDWNIAAENLRHALTENLEPLLKQWKKAPEKLVDHRISKFRTMGQASLAHAPITSGS